MKLDFTNPLMYTNYAGIKETVNLLKEYYIEEYGEEYREKISNNFERSNYVFLTTSKELEAFINNYPKILIRNTFQKILSAINGISNPYILKLQHIINKELNSIDDVYNEDINISSIIEKIKLELMQIVKHIKDKSLVELLNKQINNLDIQYFREIESKLHEQKIILTNLSKTKEKIKRNLQRQFLLEHSYLLSPEEFNKIFQEKKDINEVIINSRKLSLYLSTFFNNLVFDIGEIAIFEEGLNDKRIFRKYRKELLNELGIPFAEIELLDPNACLSKLHFMFKDENNIPRYGKEGLKSLSETIEKYNQKYKQCIDKIDYYLTSKEDFNRRNVLSEEVLNRPANIDIKNYIKQNGYNIDYESFAEEIFNVLKSSCSDNYNGCEVNLTFDLGERKFQMVYVMLKPLSINYNSGTNINCKFLYTLSHEMGHVATIDKGHYSGINQYKLYINELFNEYLSKKIMDKMLVASGYLENSHINIVNNSLHELNLFLIEPFVPEYEKVFKEASINNSLTPLIELFGNDLLNEYEQIIEDFYREQEKYEHSADIYNQNPEYIKYVKAKINRIYHSIHGNRTLKVT